MNTQPPPPGSDDAVPPPGSASPPPPPPPPPGDSGERVGTPPPPPPPGDSGQHVGTSTTPPPPPPPSGPLPGAPTQPRQPPGPPSAYGQMPTYGSPGYVPPGYTDPAAVGAPTKRADAKVAGALLIVGAVISIVGIYLPWVTGGGESINGTDVFLTSDGLIDSPGTLVWFPAIPLIGFGITLVAAGRVLAVAILAVIAAVIAEIIGLGMVGLAYDMVDISTFGRGDASLGVGVILQPIAPLIALAGGIVGIAKRR